MQSSTHDLIWLNVSLEEACDMNDQESVLANHATLKFNLQRFQTVPTVVPNHFYGCCEVSIGKA